MSCQSPRRAFDLEEQTAMRVDKTYEVQSRHHGRIAHASLRKPHIVEHSSQLKKSFETGTVSRGEDDGVKLLRVAFSVKYAAFGEPGNRWADRDRSALKVSEKADVDHRYALR